MKYKLNDKLSHPDYNCTLIVSDILKSNVDGKEYYLLTSGVSAEEEFIVPVQDVDANSDCKLVNNYQFNIGDTLVSRTHNAIVRGYCVKYGKTCYNLRIIGVYSFDDILTKEETERKFSKCRQNALNRLQRRFLRLGNRKTWDLSKTSKIAYK